MLVKEWSCLYLCSKNLKHYFETYSWAALFANNLQPTAVKEEDQSDWNSVFVDACINLHEWNTFAYNNEMNLQNVSTYLAV